MVVEYTIENFKKFSKTLPEKTRNIVLDAVEEYQQIINKYSIVSYGGPEGEVKGYDVYNSDNELIARIPFDYEDCIDTVELFDIVQEYVYELVQAQIEEKLDGGEHNI